jgi:hypothetical protein
MASSFNSAPTNVQYMDNVTYVLEWSGSSPEGTFTVQASEDYSVSSTGTVLNAGTWITLPLSATITASGTADNALLDLNQLPYSWVRLAFTSSDASSGTVNAYVSAKAV